jgi:hypothetical protein
MITWGGDFSTHKPKNNPPKLSRSFLKFKNKIKYIDLNYIQENHHVSEWVKEKKGKKKPY